MLDIGSPRLLRSLKFMHFDETPMDADILKKESIVKYEKKSKIKNCKKRGGKFRPKNLLIKNECATLHNSVQKEDKNVFFFFFFSFLQGTPRRPHAPIRLEKGEGQDKNITTPQFKIPKKLKNRDQNLSLSCLVTKKGKVGFVTKMNCVQQKVKVSMQSCFSPGHNHYWNDATASAVVCNLH